MYEDFTNHRARVDAERHASYGGIVTFYRFFDKEREYEYLKETDKCWATHFNNTQHPAFDWVANAHYGGDCHGRHDQGNVKGDLWRETGSNRFKRELCVAQNSSQTPLWVEHHHGRNMRILEFLVFTSGAPSASVFDLPDACSAERVIKRD